MVQNQNSLLVKQYRTSLCVCGGGGGGGGGLIINFSHAVMELQIVRLTWCENANFVPFMKFHK